jgi:hypothetical protein
MRVFDNYMTGIEKSSQDLLNEALAPRVRLEIPAGASAVHPADAASYVLSQVAKTAQGIRAVFTADAGSNWYLLGFEGQIAGQALQAIDQVHLNQKGRIDHIIIYMRPTPAAQAFADAIMQRLQPVE